MGKQPMHILTQLGVLSSFSISKKITEQEINKEMKDSKAKGKNADEMMMAIKNRIMQEIVDATHAGLLPGIVIEQPKPSIIPIKDIEALNRMVLILSDKFKGKKTSKLSLCYFINYLVGNLGLTEEDFERFHRKIREARNEDYDDDDEDGD